LKYFILNLIKFLFICKHKNIQILASKNSLWKYEYCKGCGWQKIIKGPIYKLFVSICCVVLLGCANKNYRIKYEYYNPQPNEIRKPIDFKLQPLEIPEYHKNNYYPI